MRVLVTRPAGSAAGTAKRLLAMGHEPVLLPLFEAHHEQITPPRKDDRIYGGLIFTSAEAIRALARAPSTLVDLRKLPVYAVGKATARTASEAGFASIHVASGDGRALARLIADIHHAPDVPLLYLAGEPRSPDLELCLGSAGIPVEVKIAYRMTSIAYSPSDVIRATSGTQAVLLYSKEAATRFRDLARQVPGMERMRLLCLSPAIAASLHEAWQTQAEVASETSEPALLGLLDG